MQAGLETASAQARARQPRRGYGRRRAAVLVGMHLLFGLQSSSDPRLL